MVGQANCYFTVLLFVLTRFLLNSSLVFCLYFINCYTYSFFSPGQCFIKALILFFTAFQVKGTVSYVEKTLLPLKTQLLRAERVAVTNLAGDTPKVEVRKL